MATLPINLIICLVFGLALAAAARTQILSGASPWQRELSLVLSFTGLSVAPTVAYFYWTFCDWSWMYLVDPGHLPTGAGLLVVVLVVLMVPLGFFLGWLLLRLLRERGPVVLFALLGFLSTGLILLAVMTRRRLLVLGRFEDFHSAPTLAPALHTAAVPFLSRPITQSKLPWAILCTAPLLLASAVVVGVALWRYGRWLRQQAETAARRSAQSLATRASRRSHDQNPGDPGDNTDGRGGQGPATQPTFARPS